MRCAAAFLVFGQHTLEEYFHGDWSAPHAVKSIMWALFADAGGPGVSFFFVLSGFVLAWSARPSDTRRAFWRRRAAKIYPNHLVTALLAIALFRVVDPFSIAANLTLTQVWFPFPAIYDSLNVVSWSLACEMFFYLCFPFVLASARGKSTAWLWWVGGGLVAGVVVVDAAMIPATHTAASWFAYHFPPVRIAEFVVGIVLALLVQRGGWRGPGLRWSLVLFAVAYVVAPRVPFPLNQQAVTLVPVALVVAAAATADSRGVRTIWSRRTLVYLGEVSFAFYLVHYLVIVGAVRAGLVPRHVTLSTAAIGTCGLFCVSVLAAMALFHGVEKPMMRRLGQPRKLGRHRKGSLRTPHDEQRRPPDVPRAGVVVR